MRGSVIKRTDAKGKVGYFVVIEERTTDGKRRRRWRSDPATGSAFTSRKAAQAHATELVASVNRGDYVEPSKLTLSAWLDTWLVLIKPTIKPSTWASYDKNVRLHIKPHLGSRELARLNAADLDGLYATLLREGRRGRGAGSGLSPRTVRYVSTILGRALKDATRKRLIARNPAADADPPTASAAVSSTMTTWTADQVGSFLAGCEEQDRFGAVLAFLASTGCRRGEALGLRWADVDLDARRASIVQTVGIVAGQVVVGSTKTNAGRRVVALDDDLVTVLREHRRRQAQLRLLMGSGWRDLDLVFPHVDGKPQYPESVSKAFKALAVERGLPPIRLHDLRHTWATLALGAGIHPKVVQERLGHANVSITLNTYSHVAPTLHDDAADAVAALMRGRR